MTSDQYRQRRGDTNAASRGQAAHHAEPWTEDELEQLEGYWDGTEETLAEIARLLGRTVEACRQKHYQPGEAKPLKLPLHSQGWLVGFCNGCGKWGDVWCDGSNVMNCEECKP